MVGVESYRDKLRLRLPRGLGSSRYINTGLLDTPENYKRVQSVAWQIEQEIQEGSLDIDKCRQSFKTSTIARAIDITGGAVGW